MVMVMTDQVVIEEGYRGKITYRNGNDSRLYPGCIRQNSRQQNAGIEKPSGEQGHPVW